MREEIEEILRATVIVSVAIIAAGMITFAFALAGYYLITFWMSHNQNEMIILIKTFIVLLVIGLSYYAIGFKYTRIDQQGRRTRRVSKKKNSLLIRAKYYEADEPRDYIQMQLERDKDFQHK